MSEDPLTIKFSSRQVAVMLVVLIISGLILSISQSGGAGSASLFTWGTKTDDRASSVTVDSVGNVYVTGGNGLSGVLLLKYSSDRSLLWQKVLQGNNSGTALGITVDSAQNVYITGLGAFLLKVNSSGAVTSQEAWEVWRNQTTDGYGVAVDQGGDVYITGTLLYNSTAQYLMLLKFSSDGSLLWQKASISLGVSGWGVAVDSAGGVYVAGQSIGRGVLLKFNSTGSLRWQRSWLPPDSNGEAAMSVVTDSVGNIIIGGWSCGCSTSPSGYQSFNATVSKFGADGSMIWRRAWMDISQGSYPDAKITRVAVDSVGNIYAVGFAAGTFLMKLDSSGNLLSLSRLYGGASAPAGVVVDLSGTPVTVGSIDSSPSNYHAQALSPKLDFHLPQLNTTAGTLKDLHYPLVNLTGTMMDANGSTAYAGGWDVFFNYGLSFPLPAISPLQMVLLVVSIIALTHRISDKHRTP